MIEPLEGQGDGEVFKSAIEHTDKEIVKAILAIHVATEPQEKESREDSGMVGGLAGIEREFEDGW